MSGDDDFELNVQEVLKKAFQCSKLEENNFKYCGCRITTKANGDLVLDLNKYVEKLQEIDRNDVENERISTKG